MFGLELGETELLSLWAFGSCFCLVCGFVFMSLASWFFVCWLSVWGLFDFLV